MRCGAPVAVRSASPILTAMATAQPINSPTLSEDSQPLESGPVAVVAVPSANLRAGPGTGYPVVGQASAGELFPIAGRNAPGDWWQVEQDGALAWIYAELARVEGDVASVAVVEAAPPPAPEARPTQSARVQVYETSISIPTYPYAAFTEEAFNPQFNWTYRRFDRAAYEASNPQPVAQTYTLVVLENEYLRVTLLPELGGRIYQVIFKPTGSNEFYQNPVIKPSPWGPPEQGGWLAAGGLEWGLPVEEHGYAWADRWGHITLPFDAERAGVTVFMPDEGHLRAEVDVILRAGEAAFTLQPRIVNPTGQAVSYQFWLDAMLAPGPANTVGPGLRFLFPTSEMTVHSRGDEYLPAEGAAMAWPLYQGRDYSLLGVWNRWLGFFERPAAHGPYAGVYNQEADEGMIRVYPPSASPGSKAFGLGWNFPLAPENYTDDGSAYVEVHGGVAPTFWDQATLAAGATTSWQETWYPVAGISGVSYADGNGAVHLEGSDAGLEVGVFPVRSLIGRVQLDVEGRVILDEPVSIDPVEPFYRTLDLGALPGELDGAIRVTLSVFDASSRPVIHYAQEIALY